jgi:hypothetical protein
VIRPRVVWAFVALVALLGAGTGAFVASGVVDELFREVVPGDKQPDSGVKVNRKQSIGGVTVTLERAYADANTVVVGYTVDGLTERTVEGRDPDVVFSEAELTDASSTRFELLNEYGRSRASGDPVPEGSQIWAKVFEVQEKLETSDRHRFRLEVVMEAPTPEGWEPVTKPFVFDLELRVRPVHTIRVAQTVESNGLSLTLDRVEISPTVTQAIICFDPPDDGRSWVPLVETGPADPHASYATNPVEKKGCSKFIYDDEDALYGRPGRHSLLVTEIESDFGQGPDRTVSGPWKFSFEVPDP